MSTQTPTTTERTPAARRGVQMIIGLFIAAWLATAVVAALGLHGAAAGIVAVAVLALGAAGGWLWSRRVAARAARELHALGHHGDGPPAA